MKLYNLFILTIVSLVAMSCSDFLEEKSQDEKIPSTVTDFREIVLEYQYLYVFPQPIYVLDDDVMLDESKLGSTDNSTAKRMEGAFTWQPDMWERPAGTLADRYINLYQQISGMNVVLEKVMDSEGSLEEKEIVEAQALGGRAYAYFILVNTFGAPYNHDKDAPGVVLKLESQLEGEGMKRSTVEEVYSRIVQDLERVSAILNKYPKQRRDHLMNKTAADILLSRVYLYMEEWDKAIVAADRAIGSAEGLRDYTSQPAGKTFELTTYDNPEVEWLFGNESWTTNAVIKPSDELMNLYDENDRRVNLVSKVSDKIKSTNSNGNIMIRTAEAYLNRAEARVLSPTPDLARALADLNELRRHRIVGYEDVSITNADELLKAIREERRKEFCFECHRWFDLRRYGMPSISHDFKVNKTHPLLRYTLEEKDPLYTLPFPQTVLESNVKLEQNPLPGSRAGVPINN